MRGLGTHDAAAALTGAFFAAFGLAGALAFFGWLAFFVTALAADFAGLLAAGFAAAEVFAALGADLGLAAFFADEGFFVAAVFFTAVAFLAAGFLAGDFADFAEAGFFAACTHLAVSSRCTAHQC